MFASRRLWRRMYAMCIRPPFRVSRVRVELMGWLFVFFLLGRGWLDCLRTYGVHTMDLIALLLFFWPGILRTCRIFVIVAHCCGLLRSPSVWSSPLFLADDQP